MCCSASEAIQWLGRVALSKWPLLVGHDPANGLFINYTRVRNGTTHTYCHKREREQMLNQVAPVTRNALNVLATPRAPWQEPELFIFVARDRENIQSSIHTRSISSERMCVSSCASQIHLWTGGFPPPRHTRHEITNRLPLHHVPHTMPFPQSSSLAIQADASFLPSLSCLRLGHRSSHCRHNLAFGADSIILRITPPESFESMIVISHPSDGFWSDIYLFRRTHGLL
jgi:hypothetical protein